MLIGLGFGFDHEEDISSDLEALKDMGCEKLFLAGYRAELPLGAQNAIGFARKGDTLAVVDLDRLGKSFKEIIAVIDALRTLGVSLHVARRGILPGTAMGDSFLQSCQVLCDTYRLMESDTPQNHRRQQARRGRPASLEPETMAKAAKLLENDASVIDVAKILNVSTATIYRYFPRRKPSSMQKIIQTGHGETATL